MSFVGEVMVLELGTRVSTAKGVLKPLFAKTLAEMIGLFFIFTFEYL